MINRPDDDILIRAMPLVFVVIWSTGFIVARYGMPLAPPMTFLALRYTFSILCFLLWIKLARVSWPTTRQLPTAMIRVSGPTSVSPRCSSIRVMCSTRLEFSTSKKTARRAAGVAKPTSLMQDQSSSRPLEPTKRSSGSVNRTLKVVRLPYARVT